MPQFDNFGHKVNWDPFCYHNSNLGFQFQPLGRGNLPGRMKTLCCTYSLHLQIMILQT